MIFMLPMDNAGPARGRLFYMLFMLVLFMMFSPSPPNPYRNLAFDALAAREMHSLEILQNATYTEPFEIPLGLNLTGVFPLPSWK
jgi:hypothetical protein